MDFHASLSPPKGGKTEQIQKGKSVRKSPQLQWIIHSHFSQIQDFLKINPNNPNLQPHHQRAWSL